MRAPGLSDPRSAAMTATTWNPSDKATTIALSAGNLTATKTTNSTNWVSVRGTTSRSGSKVYFETTDVNGGSIGTPAVGIANGAMVLQSAGQNHVGLNNDSVGYKGTGQIFLNGVTLATFDPWQDPGDIARLAFDLAGQLVWVGRVGSGLWNGSVSNDPSTGVGGISFAGINAGPYFVGGSVFFDTIPDSITANFGATAFASALPAGYSAWA